MSDWLRCWIRNRHQTHGRCVSGARFCVSGSHDARPSSSTYPCAAERTRERGVSSISLAIWIQRSARRPPPMTANASISSQNQKSDASSKQLAQVDVPALRLRELEQSLGLELEHARDDQSGNACTRMLLMLTASL